MNEKKIWAYLLRGIGSPYGAAGLMGNLYAESGLNPRNLQGSYEKSLGMTDDEYTAAVDDGSYTNFVTDKAGYGLAQWTYSSRKRALLDWATAQGQSIGDLETQLDFLMFELRTDFWSVYVDLVNAQSVREASDAVMLRFEKPKNQSEENQEKRAAFGQKYFDQFGEGGDKMTDVQRVIDIASGEVGYLEKNSNAQLDDKTANAGSNNYTKYARDLDALSWFNGKKQGYAWCAVFVTWCFYQAYGMAAKQMLFQPDVDNCAAGCSSARSYFNKQGHLHDAPEPGDQVFFWSSDMSKISHTGLVVAVDGEHIYTIEGNTSGGSDVIPNGGAVCKKSYALGYHRIAGYGCPAWNIEQGNEPEPFTDYAAQVYAESGSTVNLRASASDKSAVIAKVPIGMCVTVTKEVDDTWARCVYDDPQGQSFTGYMMRKFLREPADESSPLKTVTISRDRLVALKATLVPFIHDAQILLEQVEAALTEGG